MLKRIFDILLTASALIVFAPVILILSLLIRLKLGTPVIFRQQRPGLLAKPFYIYKFRTMSEKKDAHGALLPDAERMTSFGRIIRSTSLDELPSLWSVLKGDMSLVGPRPLLMEYIPLYSAEQSRRHDVKPGVTGWAQVNGRNAISWEDKFKFDVWYVDHQSIFFDIKILFLTVKKVFIREGINADGEATTSKFRGSH